MKIVLEELVVENGESLVKPIIRDYLARAVKEHLEQILGLDLPEGPVLGLLPLSHSIVINSIKL